MNEREITEPNSDLIIKIHRNERGHVSKIDISVTISLILLGTFEVIVNYIIDNKDIYINDKAKYWIGMCGPVITYLLSVVKSIQLGMEIKEAHVRNGTGKFEQVIEDEEALNKSYSTIVTLPSRECHSAIVPKINIPSSIVSSRSCESLTLERPIIRRKKFIMSGRQKNETNDNFPNIIELKKTQNDLKKMFSVYEKHNQAQISNDEVESSNQHEHTKMFNESEY